MAFYALSFQYDGIPSETYDLVMSEIDASGTNESDGSSSFDISEERIFRRAVPYFYGATPSSNLSFEVSVTSPREIDAETAQLIQKWLFSSRNYKPLVVIQPDMQGVYFNAILNNPKIIRVGNVIQGFRATVQCDAPYAFTFPKTLTYNYTVPNVDAQISFLNTSDDTAEYVKPKLEITVNEFGGGIEIINTSESNRSFKFENLLANEVLTIDNSLEIISSDSGQKRLGNFNKNFLRFIPGANMLRILGSVKTLKITTKFVAKKIGG